jgi:phosphoglycerate dehydrogenase-like enzyme
MLRVLYCGTGWLDAVPLYAEALAAAGLDAAVSIADPSVALAEQLAEVDVALPSNAPFGAHEFAAAPRLRLVQQPASGFEGIDLAAARERGVPVCNAPGANADSVAQAALLLLLSLARRVQAARQAFARGRIGGPVGLELTGRTLGIVGLGRSGARLAEVAGALGMRAEGVRRADGRAGLLALLARADAVSLHCPLDERTRGMIDDEAFATMRPGALLVNVARGGIVDRGALERALAGGRLGGVGLDVFWREPWDARDPLFARDDVVTLPHVAGSTREAFARVGAVLARNARAVLAGEPLVHRVDGG